MTGILVDIRSKCFQSEGKAEKHLAIKDLRFALHNGEFSCLVGPSGCGKTTLLHILAGLDARFDGNITFDYRDMQPTIGYVFQEPRLLPWRTVRENINLALQPDRPHESVDELLLALDLGNVQHVFPERLSLGMSRRVALARAFAIRPDLLLMDEPFVSLDGPTARKAHNLLAEVWNERPHTVLFVTHDLREAITLADRLIFLSHAPTRVVSEVPVSIARCDRNREAAVESFRQQLLLEHPEIRELL